MACHDPTFGLAPNADETIADNEPRAVSYTLPMHRDRMFDAMHFLIELHLGDTGTADGNRGLLDIGGWQSMTLTQAAQAVQISAHPTAYAKWEASAWAWLSELG